ncbi:MAG: cyclase family protein [Deltaproteobacteria bacterium]|nr:cyclase family protein [Deltaproteobacteria bacterium]MBW2396662.1 cyclase family protein [Deltaproteobacteria bacterium]
MKLVDLTRLLDAADLERMPEAARAAAAVLVPSIDPIRPGDRGAEIMCALFGCTREDLPDGEGWGDEALHFSSHLGTHVDAPLHYGSTCEGRPARTISDIELSELYCDGVVLDLREGSEPAKGITVEALQAAIDETGAEIGPGTAVLLRTGQERFGLGDLQFYLYPGMTREGTLFLAALGAKVLGTDAVGWDRPFLEMRRAFNETGDPAEIWDGHFAGREREIFIVQQLVNLAALPSSGFKVGFFPLKLAGCSAAPARVVAFLD